MTELSDKAPTLAPPERGTQPPGNAGPPPVKRTKSPKGRRKRAKDPRRRAPTGKKAAPEPVLTPVHFDLLRDALRSGWTPYAARKHFAPLWKVSETTLRRGTDQILAEMAEARSSLPPEQRAANVIEGMWRHVRFCYDAYESTSDAKVLSGVHATLANIAKIEAQLPVQKHEHAGAVTMTVGDMPPAAIKARIAELQIKYGFGGTPKK